MKKLIPNFLIAIIFVLIIGLVGIFFSSHRTKKNKRDCASYASSEMVDNLGYGFLIANATFPSLVEDFSPPPKNYQENIGRLDEIRSRFYHFCLKIKGIESFEEWLTAKWEGQEERINDIQNDNFKFWMNQ